jgi:hydrogenase nickel incorporation protein HypA/HybF
MSILELAEEESAKRGGAKVTAVHLKIGALAGVVGDALQSSWELACENTQLQGSRLVIENIPVKVYCPVCAAPRTLNSLQWFQCPDCKNVVSEVIQGRELDVVAMEILECVHSPGS